MKRTLLIAAGLMCHSLLFAQSISKFWNSAPDQVKKLRQHSAANIAGEDPANKTTGIRQRLIALSSYEKNGAAYDITDSLTFAYTGGHNFRFDADNSFYIVSPWDPTFEYNNFDTSVYYSFGPLTAYAQSIQQYNSADKITLALNKEHNGSTLEDRDKSEYTYNSQGQVTLIKGYTWDMGTNQWKNISIDNFYYNAQGQLTIDTLYMDGGSGLVPYHITSRTYNAAGLIAQELMQQWFAGSWQNSQKYDYTYNASNKLVLNIAQGFQNNNWANQAKDSFAYNANNIKIAELTYFDMGTGWAINFMETRHINSNGLPDTIKYYNTQGPSPTLVLSETDVFTYNSYNNIEKVVIDPGTANEARFFLYYELYNDLSVENSDDKTSLKLYPNPVDDVLNISFENASSQDAAVLVYNGVGQLQTKTAINAGVKNSSLPVRALAPGTYFIKINTVDGAASYQKAFIKN